MSPVLNLSLLSTVEPRLLAFWLPVVEDSSYSESADDPIQQGWDYYHHGEFQLALQSFRAGLSQQQGDLSRMVQVIYALCLTLWQLKDYPRAIASGKQAMELSALLENRSNLGDRLTQLGSAHRLWDNPQQSLAFFERAVQIFQQADDDLGVGRSLNNLGVTYSHLGQHHRAQVLCRVAAEILADFDQEGQAIALHNAGLACCKSKDYVQAVQFFEQALVLRVAVGDFTGEAMTFQYLGRSYQALGNLRSGFTCYQESLTLRRALGDRLEEAHLLCEMANTYAQHQQATVSIDYYREALALFASHNDAKGTAWVLHKLGELLEQQGNLSSALECYHQAMAIAETLPDSPPESLFQPQSVLFDI